MRIDCDHFAERTTPALAAGLRERRGRAQQQQSQCEKPLQHRNSLHDKHELERLLGQRHSSRSFMYPSLVAAADLPSRQQVIGLTPPYAEGHRPPVHQNGHLPGHFFQRKTANTVFPVGSSWPHMANASCSREDISHQIPVQGNRPRSCTPVFALSINVRAFFREREPNGPLVDVRVATLYPQGLVASTCAVNNEIRKAQRRQGWIRQPDPKTPMCDRPWVDGKRDAVSQEVVLGVTDI